MLARGLVLLLLLAPSIGCLAQPTAAPVRNVALEAEARTVAECPEGACGYEWWNLTAEGEAARVILPAPIAWPSRMPPPHLTTAGGGDHFYPWHRNMSVVPDVMRGLDVREDSISFSVTFSRDVEMRTHQLRSAMPEEFLRARWGPEANQTRPDAIEVRGHGTLHHLLVTYEAHSEHCRREARYEWSGVTTINGSLWIPGQDVVACR